MRTLVVPLLATAMAASLATLFLDDAFRGTTTKPSVANAQNSPWIRRDWEPSHLRGHAFDTKTIGPVLTLRSLLTESQMASITSADLERVFLRFEVVDAMNTATYFPKDTTEVPQTGLGSTVTAVLYFAHRRPGNAGPFSAFMLRRYLADGREAFRQTGVGIGRVDIEVREYWVTPIDSFIKDGVLFEGTKGWKVRPDSKLIAKQTVAVGDYNDVLPLFDLSVNKPMIQSMIDKGGK